MMATDWVRVAAKAFAVVSLSAGVGFLAGAISFLAIGSRGRLHGGAFMHIADVIGWGSAFLTASLATFVMIAVGRGRRPGKPAGLDM